MATTATTAATVTAAYTDRETGELHDVGETVRLGAARLKELSDGGFVRARQARARRTRGDEQ